MANDVLTLADRLWRGEVSTAKFHPVDHIGGFVEITDGVGFTPSFANVSSFATDDGLVLVDTGSLPLASVVHGDIRRWSDARLNTAIYSHGHIDHVFGVAVWEQEAKEQGWEAPQVIAHHALPARFDRYILTAGYNTIINRRQFGFADLNWPTEYRYPDRTYRDSLDISVGGVDFALRHEKGETDDHTITFQRDTKVLCCGDLFIWASPNAGNPQKVQRYPRVGRGTAPNARTRRRVLIARPRAPGHRSGSGPPSSRRHRRPVDLLGRPDPGDHERRRPPRRRHPLGPTPADLEQRPYLRPVYDEPEFVVHTVWRQYGGWWDGNPATLKPAPERALASELAALAGGPGVLADRALELLEQAGTEGADVVFADQALRLAGHLAEHAWLAAPSDEAVQAARQRVFAQRAQRASSTMAKGVFNWTANESVAGGETGSSPHSH